MSSCEGIAHGIYDEPAASITPAEGQIVVDATSWTDWYYIDLPKLHKLYESGNKEALMKGQTEFEAYPIPMSLTGKGDGVSGQYQYWFDVFGEGIGKSEFRKYTPCDAQPEPEEWSIAIHRNNVRTNGGGVYETPFTSIDQLPESAGAFADVEFAADEWSENEVWNDRSQMLSGIVASQGIRINKVLSAWLAMDIPPMPPAFRLNNHVFVLRLADGTYAALQLSNYVSPEGKKCHLTINYKYPY